jgi:hypothetical protein
MAPLRASLLQTQQVSLHPLAAAQHVAYVSDSPKRHADPLPRIPKGGLFGRTRGYACDSFVMASRLPACARSRNF